jgi:N-acetylglucosamine kinase-like BadF-type ATPase
MVMGLDQGGSKTHVIVGTAEGRILGFGTAPGACHSIHGMGAAMAGVRLAAQKALAQAGLSSGEIDIVFAGMTGMDWPEEEELLRGALSAELHIGRVHVVNDCLIAMRGGTSHSYGAVLCAGSGLNCAALSPDGRQYVYGFYIQDADQGGGALSNAAVQAVLDAEAGLVPATALTPRLLAHCNCATVDELLRRKVSGGLDPATWLALPKLLDTAALDGIPAAIGLFAYYGRRWALYVISALRKLELLDTPLDLVLSGSIFKCRDRTLTDTLSAELAAAAASARVVEAAFEPVAGAYLLGIERLGVPASGLEERLREQAARYPLLRLPGTDTPVETITL